MSLEIGGRSDKSGNRYENRFLAKQLVRLLNEKIYSIEVEPLGKEGKGVEFITTDFGGVKRYYQCKASNGIKTDWSIYDLFSAGFFKHSKAHILADENNAYHFISPLSYKYLKSLTERARTNHCTEDYIKYQLNTDKLRDAFYDVLKYFELDKDKVDDIEKAIYILSKCYLETIDANHQDEKDLVDRIEMCFMGDSSVIRMLLENCVNDNQWYGVPIDINKIALYFEEKGFILRQQGLDKRIYPRIQMLNSTYWPRYESINNQLIDRVEVDKVLQCIRDGEFVVIHGQAGSGKSGCIEILKNNLKNMGIPHLCIKLDKSIPLSTADKFGEELGLMMSPVFALQKISGSKNCVLILDQLDALLYANEKVANALDVCKEMIKQASLINEDKNSAISIVFVIRSFDFKNDNGIKELFAKGENKRSIWKEIEVKNFTDEEVSFIVGEEIFAKLSLRLKNMLHGLYELEDNIFLKQCEKVLESDTIRYYYKCAVWETIAKSINPSNRVLEFVYKYSKQADYERYIWQVVFYENIACIKYLLLKEPIIDMKDSKMWLLQSINQKDGDFVVEQLEVFAYKNIDTDKIIWNCLCHDVGKDTPRMFEFRMNLLENAPQLLEHDGFVFYDTFKNSPRRCIKYLNFIVGNNDCEYFKDIHFPTSAVLQKFSVENSHLIVEELLPALCHATHGLHYRLPQISYEDVYLKWTNKGLRIETFRKIVDVCKWALEEFAEKSPEIFLRIIYDERYKGALITNELFLSAMCKLPIYYANNVVSWLVKDFSNNILDYTGNTANFLYNCKNVIKRFSPYCANDLFCELENKIVFWKDDIERMRRVLKNRVDHNAAKGAYKVYWAFWGHLQKELLEVICSFRLSKHAKELLQVLLRNPYIRSGHYMSHNWGGSAKFVQSPVASYAEKISDATWLQIICTPEEKMKRNRWKETENAYIEADHTTFATTLSSQALKQPVRFAELSLAFSENCYRGYVTGVLYALYSKHNEIKVEMSLLCDVIRKFNHYKDESIKIEILRLIKHYAQYEWPQDIIGIVMESIEIPYSKSDEEEAVKVYDLYNKSLNDVKCCAIRTMECLVNEHTSLRNVFLEILQRLSEDKNSVVRFTLVDSLVDCYNADENFALQIFRALIIKDLRTIGAVNTWQLLSRDYEGSEAFYNKILIEACAVNVEDLQEQAAGFICALAVYFDNKELQEYILCFKHSDLAIKHIWRQAIFTFGIANHKEISKTILLHIIQNYKSDTIFVTGEVLKEKIDLTSDKNFILEVLSCDNIIKLLPAFISYLSNIDDISFVYKAVERITEKIVQEKQDYMLRNAVNDFIKCLMNILDRCECDEEARTICLNAWDTLFKNNFRNMKALDEAMDEYVIS